MSSPIERRNGAPPAHCSVQDSVCSQVLRPLGIVLQSQGIDPGDLLGAFELQGSGPRDARIERSAWYELLDRALAITMDRRLGLHWARAATAMSGAMGLVEYVARTSDSVRGALASLMRYGRLFQGDLAFESTCERGTARLSLRSCEGAHIPPVWAEAVLGYCHSLLAQLCGLEQGKERAGPEAVSSMACEVEVLLAHGPLTDGAAYDQLFQAYVHFAAPEYAITLPSTLLDRAVPTADPYLFGLLDEHARRALVQLPRVPMDIRKRVRTVLLDELDGGDPSRQHVARMLRLSTRTLTRRLADAGTSFEEILSSLRYELSLPHLLETDLSISQIALALGFSGVSSFTRAFRRWTGISPRQARAGVCRDAPVLPVARSIVA